MDIFELEEDTLAEREVSFEYAEVSYKSNLDDVTSAGADGSLAGPSSSKAYERSFVCKICLKNFDTGRGLGGHMKTHRFEHDGDKLNDTESTSSTNLRPSAEHKDSRFEMHALDPSPDSTLFSAQVPAEDWMPLSRQAAVGYFPKRASSFKIKGKFSAGRQCKCTECGKCFASWKALFGHMRCHPEREWRGINRPDHLEARAVSLTDVSYSASVPSATSSMTPATLTTQLAKLKKRLPQLSTSAESMVSSPIRIALANSPDDESYGNVETSEGELPSPFSWAKKRRTRRFVEGDALNAAGAGSATNANASSGRALSRSHGYVADPAAEMLSLLLNAKKKYGTGEMYIEEEQDEERELGERSLSHKVSGYSHSERDNYETSEGDSKDSKDSKDSLQDDVEQLGEQVRKVGMRDSELFQGPSMETNEIAHGFRDHDEEELPGLPAVTFGGPLACTKSEPATVTEGFAIPATRGVLPAEPEWDLEIEELEAQRSRLEAMYAFSGASILSSVPSTLGHHVSG